jgi:uncharacterized protein YciI
MLYRAIIWAHVNLGDEAQKSEVVINAISREEAIRVAEKAKYKIAESLNWVNAMVERVEEFSA